ncbi:hypothetical protein CSC94_16730 [Zhengella mangrovi]|uniref:TRAP transporter small permease protein n=1 Tax=Zhengella mangrovi TaxID=1982044 RepID=A0A2G1QKH0_9HYPH|nr:TRAP transporter small permease subunit [Zhengella mangrovi]PHP65961.1 hypothetical protein CSC94_16730 [Zhengella mangrovi]
MSGYTSGEDNRGLAHSTPVEWAVRLLTTLSAASLAVVLIVTFIGVIMRYVFAAPILGSNEIIQLASVGLVMLAMPLATQQEIHIRVDVFDRRIGALGRFAGDILSRVIAAFILAMLALRAWDKMLDSAEFGDATNMLALPLWPFYGLLVVGAVLYVVVLVLQLADILRGGVNSRD